MAFRLCGAISGFADPLVLRAIKSMEKLERVFVIDGKYDGFPATMDFSDSWLRNKMTMQKNVGMYDQTGTESQKRNRYMDLADVLGYNAVLVLDSDEYIVGDIPKFMRNAQRAYENGYRVACIATSGYTKDHPELIGQPRQPKKQWARVFLRPAGLAYHPEFHSVLVGPDSVHYELTEEQDYALIDGIMIVHDTADRSLDYKARRKEYHTWLHRQEEAKKLAPEAME